LSKTRKLGAADIKGADMIERMDMIEGMIEGTLLFHRVP
jgi:hypothetical protein